MSNPPNFIRGVGRLATDRLDFQAHLDGVNPPGFTDFRHTAGEIDMAPPVIDGATTVQTSLQNVAAFIASQAGVGGGFITVGEGYDCWQGPTGTGPNNGYNFTPNTPFLDTLLNPAFAAITAFQAAVASGSGTPPAVPAAFERVKFGGIIVIQAGTYLVQKTINVPPGIVLIGEGYGTKIVNATNLAVNLSTNLINVTPPIQWSVNAFPITNATNTTPIQITTEVPIPNLANGDIITITEVVSSPSSPNPFNSFATSTNPWAVETIIGPNTFTLQNSMGAGSSSYVSGGFVTIAKPLFKILADNNRIGIGTNTLANDAAIGGSTDLFSFQRETKIMNMVISDNFVEATALGDVYYKIPQNVTSSTIVSPSLIQQEAGSSLVLDQVMLMGRANASAWTVSAVFLDTNNTAQSILRAHNCTIDGFSIPIFWLNNSGGSDYLEVSNCKIRGYGYFAGIGIYPSTNSLMSINDATSKITNNILYADCNSGNVSVFSAVFVSGNVSPNPVLQSRGKLTVAMNDLIVDKTSNSPISFVPVQANASPINTHLSVLTYGNNFQDSCDFSIDNTLSLQVQSDNVIVPNITIEGGTIAGCTFSGITEVSSSGFIIFEPSSSLVIGGFETMQSGAVIEYTSGSELLIDTGTTVTANLGTGSNLNLNTGSLATLTGTIDGYLTWESSALIPSISQNLTSSANGQNLTIQAQSASGFHTGGNLILESGSSGVGESFVNIQPGSVGGTLSVYPPQGTVSTQSLIASRYMTVCHTLATGPNVTFFTLSMANNTAALVEITYIRRHTTSPNAADGNRGAYQVLCGNTGTITTATNPVVCYSGYDDGTTITSAASTTNTLILQMIASGFPANEDIQFIIDVNLC